MRYQVDAVILASATLSSAFARECRRAGVPVLLFNRTNDDPDVSSITGSNEVGGRVIASFLAAGGHRRDGLSRRSRGLFDKPGSRARLQRWPQGSRPTGAHQSCRQL
jgi:DNA-binding LacI/PurR family transcriptional regulator